MGRNGSIMGSTLSLHRHIPIGGLIPYRPPSWTAQGRALVYKRFSDSVDRARLRLLSTRKKLTKTIGINLAESEMKKKHRRRNLNSSANRSFMPSREMRELLHNSTTLMSTVPRKVKYSVQPPKERVYGKIRWVKHDV